MSTLPPTTPWPAAFGAGDRILSDGRLVVANAADHMLRWVGSGRVLPDGLSAVVGVVVDPSTGVERVVKLNIPEGDSSTGEEDERDG